MGPCPGWLVSSQEEGIWTPVGTPKVQVRGQGAGRPPASQREASGDISAKHMHAAHTHTHHTHHTPPRVHTSTHVCTHTRTYTCACNTQKHTCAHTRSRTHTHNHTHAHTRVTAPPLDGGLLSADGRVSLSAETEPSRLAHIPRSRHVSRNLSLCPQLKEERRVAVGHFLGQRWS